MKKLHTFVLYSTGLALSFLGVYISKEFVATPDRGVVAKASAQCVDQSATTNVEVSQGNENQLLFVSCGGFIQ